MKRTWIFLRIHLTCRNMLKHTDIMNSIDSEKMMTQKDVMDLLQISRTTLHRLRKEGVIPTYKVGKQEIRFKRSEIEEYVNHQY